MTAFQDLPIRRKLLLLTLAPLTTALLLSGAGFLAWDISERRREILADVSAEARVLPESVAAAVQFGDQEVARQTLDVLEIRPHVRFACLYDDGNELFESYERDRSASCPVRPPLESTYGLSSVDVVAPLVSGTAPVGTFYLSRDLDDVWRRLQLGSLTILGLLVVAAAAALVLARGMQRSVSEPLLGLADVARTVSSTRDYSLRATGRSRDEIGLVIRSFNEMLDRIADRTADLSAANTELLREVDERKRVERDRLAALERERDANRLKDEFLATVSHELRTPLNAVLGWTRVLRSTDADDATRERGMESIERNARTQARLIEDLLEISRIVTGKLRLQVRDIDFATIVETAVENVRPAASAKRLQLDVSIEARPALTTGDPDRLQQVVWNLLSNAVKFTPADGSISVRLARQGGYVLTVRDTGSGIEAKFLPHVFDAFRQADGSATREHGGLGLGLAIARQLVEAHGGTIQAESDGRDRGATFEVFLPSIVTAQPPAGASAAPADRVDATLLRGIDILVVDDVEDARVLLQMTLTRYGATVRTAGSVSEALAAIDRALPHIVVSDIGMPHEDGYDLVRRLRARTPERGGTIPAVALTAYASATDRSSAEAAGYQAHVAKPFDPLDVARLVRRLVSNDKILTATDG